PRIEHEPPGLPPADGIEAGIQGIRALGPKAAYRSADRHADERGPDTEPAATHYGSLKMMMMPPMRTARVGPSHVAPSQMRLGSDSGRASALELVTASSMAAPVGTAPLIALASAPPPPRPGVLGVTEAAPAAAAISAGGVAAAVWAAWLAAACCDAAVNPGSRAAAAEKDAAAAAKSPRSAASRPRLYNKKAVTSCVGRSEIAVRSPGVRVIPSRSSSWKTTPFSMSNSACSLSALEPVAATPASAARTT